MTIAVHRSVISAAKTGVFALGEAVVWGRPAAGGGIAVTLGDGLGAGLGLGLGLGLGVGAAAADAVAAWPGEPPSGRGLEQPTNTAATAAPDTTALAGPRRAGSARSDGLFPSTHRE
ncbi:MAG: hypothetical protein WBH47_23595 [Streptosporangiaceae bacterium]